MDATRKGVRFAPSPTGVFHVGNLRTAWISRLWAEALAEPWVVRFEDIDGPRVVDGAVERQLADMKALGLVPDFTYLQSRRLGRHLELFKEAQRRRAVYPCFCSRNDVREALDASASAPHSEPPLYSGKCRDLKGPPEDVRSLPSLAWRFRSEAPSGAQDFIVARTNLDGSEFAPAYAWACAVDDADGRYALLVRASDLAHALTHQRAIQRWMALGAGVEPSYPAVYHAALVTRDDGGRLEKRTKGVTLEELQSRGISADEILSRFRASFDEVRFREQVATFEPGNILAESRAEIQLHDVGLEP